MLKRLFAVSCIFLSGCTPTPASNSVTRADMEIIGSFTVNPFPVAAIEPLSISNRQLADDFIDLTMELETGTSLPVFTRFEGPISVRLQGAVPAPLPSELNRLLARLRSEAKIDIYQTKAPTANINIHAISRNQIRKTFPMAACFVAPNVENLAEFQKFRRTAKTSWSQQEVRTKVSIFLPSDATPQEIRDCLHEEFAQSMAPLNDMYRLPNSVFNDDNVHTILTNFDMMILKIAYSPELRSGMTREDLRQRLPSILSRLNPRGDAKRYSHVKPTSREWNTAITTALGPGTPPQMRPRAAKRALEIAQTERYNDHRLGFSYFALGRVTQHQDPRYAFEMFQIANKIYAKSVNAELYAAHTAAQIAATQIALGNGEDALLTLAQHIDVAFDNENAALLSTLMLLRAEALELTGRASEAQKVRLDSLTWARYGFGSESNLKSKLREINALNPLKRNNG